ncbi:uncharacterized protein BDZ83DRAFT_747489 [Colletotrichum acutatum]|uniref:Uncharacterized protein n=1 Tax=Glomerella acutata TaxID=27357 RepID=A0AAD8XMW4_GLOAC|nr:uncharacterized protein BDZ83DRAFT_747489 [Colletotrichum acutatum]KAK1730266.1 hypothetical protein BDZ83DRAFT_747489 [Colletotrichum acutatum]
MTSPEFDSPIHARALPNHLLETREDSSTPSPLFLLPPSIPETSLTVLVLFPATLRHLCVRIYWGPRDLNLSPNEILAANRPGNDWLSLSSPAIPSVILTAVLTSQARPSLRYGSSFLIYGSPIELEQASSIERLSHLNTEHRDRDMAKYVTITPIRAKSWGESSLEEKVVMRECSMLIA